MQRSVIILLILTALVCFTYAQRYQDVTTLGVPFRFQNASEAQWTYYKLDIDQLLSGMNSTDTVTFTVTSYSGDVDLVIQTNVFPLDKECDVCWKSTTARGDAIVISRSDRRWPIGSPSYFFIGVYSVTVSTFSFNVWTSPTHIVLAEGEPQSASATAGKAAFFEYMLDAQENFTISVSPTNGDPDIVASIDIREPSSESYTWKAERWGFDVLRITTNDPKYRSGVKYNIGVYGFPDTAFTIAASKDSSYTLLTESTALYHTVQGGSYRYFKYIMMQPNTDLVFTVSPLSSYGDPDIFITYNREGPSSTNYDYRANMIGADTVTIPSARVGTYYVGVYGYGNSDFQIMATTEYKNIALREGIPFRSTLTPGRYTYFKYYQGDSESGLVITLTAISGDAYVYVSTTNTHPTSEPGKYDFMASKFGNQYIAGYPSGHTGNIYVGVYATTNLTYSIVATSNQSYTYITEGQMSFFNRVNKGYYRYFIYDQMDATQDATISVNPWSGETSLYVSEINPKPTRYNYTYSSENYKQDSVVVPARSTGGMRRFYIGVYGEEASSFSISAFMSNSTTVEIREGYSMTGAVAPGKYNYYKFYVKEVGSVTINLELTDPSSSDADIYASTVTQKPSSLDYEYKGEKYGNDFIRIPQATIGWIYIGVYGFYGNISYTLTVGMESMYLSPGRADLISSAATGKVKHFKTFVYHYCEYFVVSTSTINGKTALYASSNDTIVTPQNAMFSSKSWPGNVILVKNTDSHFRGGTWSMSVYAETDSDFFISAVCGYPYFFAYITENIPRLGAVPANKTISYMFIIPQRDGSVADNYYMNIRPYHGIFDVEVTHQDLPGKRWNATSVMQATTIVFDKKDLVPGYMQIRVTGHAYRNLDSIFEITLGRDGAPVFLNQDLPYSQFSPNADQTTYYRVLNSASNPRDLQVYIESCNDNSVPVAYVDTREEKPTESSPYKTSSTSKFTGSVKVPKASTNFFYMGVKGTQYAIYATMRTDSLPVLPDRKRLRGVISNDFLTVIVPAIKAPAVANITYTFYGMKVDNAPRDFNFDTSCAVTSQGKRWIVTRQEKQDDGTVKLTVIPPQEKDAAYRVNVLAQDGYGVAVPYKAAWFVGGFISDDYPTQESGPLCGEQVESRITGSRHRANKALSKL
jgi:hypothetical protein